MDDGIPTILVGFGRIGAGYAEDAAMARHYRYATHAQVLHDHPAFRWTGVVDPSDAARTAARDRWSVPDVTGDISSSKAASEAEVAVIATPPAERCALLDQLPNLRAVIVEKPLASSPAEAVRFLTACEQRGIAVQVNLWRRADPLFRGLAEGGLSRWIGAVQAAFGVYGNGLHNNGLHMIDLARMLLGEVAWVTALSDPVFRDALPLEGDCDLTFALALDSGPCVVFSPVDFSHYRENALDLWGTESMLSIRQEGLLVRVHPRADNRAMTGEGEIASDEGCNLDSTVGIALRSVYDNLADHLSGSDALVAPGRSALASEAIVDAVVRSAREGGKRIAPDRT